jgi:hypothetical protein
MEHPVHFAWIKTAKGIEIPRMTEILGSSCFSRCESLSAISFESNSRLKRIGSLKAHNDSRKLMHDEDGVAIRRLPDRRTYVNLKKLQRANWKAMALSSWICVRM